MRWWTVTAIGCLGCTRIFGIENTQLEPPSDGSTGPDADERVDLDRDGIKDFQDPCIAPDTDLFVDTDGDGTTNNSDPCPLDNVATADGDGDGIGDRCDPFPQQAGDRTRCLMAFTDPDLDVRMWTPREDPPAWQVGLPRLLVGNRLGSVRAEWPFEAPGAGTTTYQAEILMYQPYAEVSLWARSGTTMNYEEAGCLVAPGDQFAGPAAIGGGWTIRASGAGTPTTSAQMPSGIYTRMWLTATFTPSATGGANTLKCTVQFDSGLVLTAAGSIDLGSGNLAISTTSPSYVHGITVYERDDAQAL